jgi:hypothetical protein
MFLYNINCLLSKVKWFGNLNIYKIAKKGKSNERQNNNMKKNDNKY